MEKQAVRDIQLPDEDAEIDPVSTDGGGQKPEPEMDRLSNIIRDFNDRFGNIKWKDQDKIEEVIAEELPAKVAGDRAYRNAMANSDRQNARIEHDKALERAMTELLADHTELFKQFSDNASFRRWLSEMVFAATYSRSAATAGGIRKEGGLRDGCHRPTRSRSIASPAPEGYPTGCGKRLRDRAAGHQEGSQSHPLRRMDLR